MLVFRSNSLVLCLPISVALSRCGLSTVKNSVPIANLYRLQSVVWCVNGIRNSGDISKTQDERG